MLRLYPSLSITFTLSKSTESCTPKFIVVIAVIFASESPYSAESATKRSGAKLFTIACFASTSRIILPEIIHSYEEKYPGIGITLLEGGTDEIVNWVNDEAADFGILSRRNIDTLHFIPLMRDPLVAILPKEEPYTSMKEFDIKEFEQQPFIISAEGTDYDIHHMIQKTGIKPDTRLTSRDDHAIVSMVAAHLGISILPMLVVKDLLYMVHAIPLKPYFDREIGICYLDKGAVSPAAKNFMYLIREKFAENNASNS